jgi:uncharacterized protein (TIGR02145 family)
MKNQRSVIFAILSVMVFSCGKKSEPQTSNTVVVNGTPYPTVTIGDQVWTNQNYSGVTVEGPATNIAGTTALTGKYYEIGDEFALPQGWRLPTRLDFNVLLENLHGVANGANYTLDANASLALYTVSGWNNVTGTNLTGFNAFPAGLVYYNSANLNNSVDYKGNNACFLSAIQTDAANNQVAYELVLDNFNGASVVQFQSSPSPNINTLISVRFVRDK